MTAIDLEQFLVEYLPPDDYDNIKYEVIEMKMIQVEKYQKRLRNKRGEINCL